MHIANKKQIKKQKRVNTLPSHSGKRVEDGQLTAETSKAVLKWGGQVQVSDMRVEKKILSRLRCAWR